MYASRRIGAFRERRMTRTTRRALAGAALVVTFGLGAMTGALADQPHMQSALNHLMAARDELQQASSDKGGHRVAALEAVNNAIRHTRQGIQYDRRH
jgi:hypothetical protein